MKMISSAVIASVLCAALSSAAVSANEPRAGVHYRAIETAQSDQNIQFFSLGCRHCYRFESGLENWAHKETLERLPLHFDKKQWIHYAKVYFALRDINFSDDIIPVLFDEIHRNHNRELSLEKVATLFDMNAKQTQELKSSYKSDQVKKQVDAAASLAKQYRVTGVPAMVIQGKYVTDAAMTRGIHGLMRVSDYLYDIGNNPLATAANDVIAPAPVRGN